MKTLKDFLREQNMPFDGVRSGIIDVQDKEVRENINILLNRATHEKYLTPYIAFERVSKVLANFLIFLPNQGFMEGDFGNAVIPVEQFGIKAGMTNTGQFVTKGEVEKDFTHGPHVGGEGNEEVSEPQDIKCFVYFEYQLGDCGMFNVFCQIVEQEELDEILADLEEESQEDGDDEEELNEAAPDLANVVSDTKTGKISLKNPSKGGDLSRVTSDTKTGKLSVREEKDEPPFEPTGSTTNAKTPRNVAKRLAQKAMKQAKEKASNKK